MWINPIQPPRPSRRPVGEHPNVLIRVRPSPWRADCRTGDEIYIFAFFMVHMCATICYLSILDDGSTAVNIAKVSLVVLADLFKNHNLTIKPVQLELWSSSCASGRSFKKTKCWPWTLPWATICYIFIANDLPCQMWTCFVVRHVHFQKQTCVPTKRTLCSYSWIEYLRVLAGKKWIFYKNFFSETQLCC